MLVDMDVEVEDLGVFSLPFHFEKKGKKRASFYYKAIVHTSLARFARSHQAHLCSGRFHRHND